MGLAKVECDLPSPLRAIAGTRRDRSVSPPALVGRAEHDGVLVDAEVLGVAVLVGPGAQADVKHLL